MSGNLQVMDVYSDGCFRMAEKLCTKPQVFIVLMSKVIPSCGARPYCEELIFCLLNKHFGENVIALDYWTYYGSCIDWPAYSLHLDLCDLFLWEYL